MSTMLIAMNQTKESGSFCGDQLCSLKTARLFIEGQPDVDRVIMSVSPGNDFAFFWDKFIRDPRGDGGIPQVELVRDDWNPGDWSSRWTAWDKWRSNRAIEGKPFDHYRELYLRIHGAQRQQILCGSERGLGRRNIYSYWYCGQEHCPEELPLSADWFDGSFIDHPPHQPVRDVYISPHAKTQGNITFSFDYWERVVRKLVDAGITVTVGYNGGFCDDLLRSPLYKKFWGTHQEWMQEVCKHKIVACGNTGTGWLACACNVPILTAEPVNSMMPDHRYRECGLRNIVEVMDQPDADYCATRLVEFVNRKVVMTTGCYDILHAGHVRHLQKCRSLGTRLVVALNSDESTRKIKGIVDGVQRPINPQDQRRAVLEELRCVDEVRVFDGADAKGLIAELRPDVLACGFGYTVDTIAGRDIVEAYGGRVVVTFKESAATDASTTKIVRRARAVRPGDLAEVCRTAAMVSVNPFDKLKLLADQLLSVADVPGDMADLGAYMGGASMVMRWAAPDRHLHVFDTWEGNPHDDDLCHHKKGEWKATLDQCRRVVGNGGMTHYHQGVFPDNAMKLGVVNPWLRGFSFVYVDPDTYQTVRDAIEFFWPRMLPGGKMVFDDYSWPACAGVKKAVDEAFTEQQRRVVESQYACIVEKR